MKRGSFEKLLHSQGSAPTFDGLPVDNIPSFYKAENQKPTEVSIALFKASSDGNIEEIRHALLQGGNPNWFNHAAEGATAIFAAAENGHLEAVKILIDAGGALDLKLLTTKNNLFHVCTTHNRLEIMQCLADRLGQEGAHHQINLGNMNGNTSLHFACMIGNPELVRFLINQGADCNLHNKRESSALHFIAYSTVATELKTEIINMLLENGARINTPDASGQTPLHVAAIKEDEPICRLLLLSGAQTEIQDQNGHTPKYYAEIKDNLELKSLLDS